MWRESGASNHDPRHSALYIYEILIFTSIPLKDGLEDWDCAEALVVRDIVTSLDHIQKHGTFPVCPFLSVMRRRSDFHSLTLIPEKTKMMSVSALFQTPLLPI